MAKVTYLEFEKPVAQLEEKIQELRDMSSGSVSYTHLTLPTTPYV